ncbi:MAG: hypothetical protein HGA37_07210 [Lentimicrobium sp.]|nr:hypothetical protein [Lentimicrobium sp.]
MKTIQIFGLVLLTAFACTQQKETTKSQRPATAIEIDSTEYEITIIDPDFDTWYLLNFTPVLDMSNEYYRTKNGLGVSNWNQYFTRGRYPDAIGSYINYIQSEDYGIEVNRKLYWYFKYIEDNYKIRLLR